MIAALSRYLLEFHLSPKPVVIPPNCLTPFRLDGCDYRRCVSIGRLQVARLLISGHKHSQYYHDLQSCMYREPTFIALLNLRALPAEPTNNENSLDASSSSLRHKFCYSQYYYYYLYYHHRYCVESAASARHPSEITHINGDVVMA